MGVKFDRILDGFDGPFEKINGLITPAAGKVKTAPAAIGYLTSPEVNDSFISPNRLLKDNEEVYWIKQPFNAPSSAGGKTYPAGTIFIPAKPSTQAKLQKIAAELGVNFEAIAVKPSGEMLKLRAPRIGLWDRYGGSMPSGGRRWLLEQIEFPFTVVYPPTFGAGDPAGKIYVVVFAAAAIRAPCG